MHSYARAVCDDVFGIVAGHVTLVSRHLQESGNDVTKMGRPGGGAPLKTTSGKVKNFRVEDPQLRFQFHAPDRHMVDNDLRYRSQLKDQRAYKMELGKNTVAAT